MIEEPNGTDVDVKVDADVGVRPQLSWLTLALSSDRSYPRDDSFATRFVCDDAHLQACSRALSDGLLLPVG